MDGLCSKLECLFEPVKVTDYHIALRNLRNMSIFLHYQSVMLYSRDPWGLYHKTFYDLNKFPSVIS
jgi:hypothetical protein